MATPAMLATPAADLSRHSRESGNPGRQRGSGTLDPRFRGGDDAIQMGTRS